MIWNNSQGKRKRETLKLEEYISPPLPPMAFCAACMSFQGTICCQEGSPVTTFLWSCQCSHGDYTFPDHSQSVIVPKGYQSNTKDPISIAVTNTMTKSDLGRKGFISHYTSISRYIIVRSQCRNSSRKLEAGTETETTKKCTYWLVPHGLLTLLFFCAIQHHPLRGGTIQVC